MDYTARAIGLHEFRACLCDGIPVGPLRLFFRVEVVEVAVELVEAVVGGQKLIPVAEVVFAELCRGITKRLERLGDGNVTGLETRGGTGNTDLRQAGPLG